MENNRCSLFACSTLLALLASHTATIQTYSTVLCCAQFMPSSYVSVRIVFPFSDCFILMQQGVGIINWWKEKGKLRDPQIQCIAGCLTHREAIQLEHLCLFDNVYKYVNSFKNCFYCDIEIVFIQLFKNCCIQNQIL